jgi:hypothetical protein
LINLVTLALYPFSASGLENLTPGGESHRLKRSSRLSSDDKSAHTFSVVIVEGLLYFSLSAELLCPLLSIFSD